MNYKTDIVQVSGRGSAETGASHWFGERLKSVALIPLTIIFICIIAPLIGADHSTVVGSLQSPVKGFALIIFFLVTLKHLEEGLQVVIEDYVHTRGRVLILIKLNKLFCWTFGLVAIFAIAKITFAS